MIAALVACFTVGSIAGSVLTILLSNDLRRGTEDWLTRKNEP